MSKRYVSIWFRHLLTDWLIRRRPALKDIPFVFAAPVHGRMIITAASVLAQAQGVDAGAVVADARAAIPSLQVFNDKPGRADKLLTAMAEWCIRFTPVAAIDPPDGIILDVSGCAHLWGSERAYLTEIIMRLKKGGYQVRGAMADTIGAAWAIARFGQVKGIVENSGQTGALLPMPAAALRLPVDILLRLKKLGLFQIGSFIKMPRTALRRRFGEKLLYQLDLATGWKEEILQPVHPLEQYQERLPCIEPIVTATGIEMALMRLLEILCLRLQQEEKGLRAASFKGYRVDGKIEEIKVGTNSASHNTVHLFKLFETRIAGIEPALGIELFILEAGITEDMPAWQQNLWAGACGLQDTGLAELLDRLVNRMGAGHIQRYLPAAHYWPERSIKPAAALTEKPAVPWQADRPRPTRLLAVPEPVEVISVVPDYPPVMFRYKNKMHKIKKADGPERIEREWWIEEGLHRDYYCVEDEEGSRYWLFRSGHYTPDKPHEWFVHGFFA